MLCQYLITTRLMNPPSGHSQSSAGGCAVPGIPSDGRNRWSSRRFKYAWRNASLFYGKQSYTICYTEIAQISDYSGYKDKGHLYKASLVDICKGFASYVCWWHKRFLNTLKMTVKHFKEHKICHGFLISFLHHCSFNTSLTCLSPALAFHFHCHY